MRLSALALDYDGTIAQGDAIGASVREAIAAVRDSGISVLLVTGRSLSELCRVAGDLHFVDGVVAENGAVIHFPANDYSQVLAPPVAPAFTAELRRRGIAGQAGQCLVDFDTRDAPHALEVIRDLELPIVLVFNRGRVMAMPQGVSKATGLQTMLNMLPRLALVVVRMYFSVLANVARPSWTQDEIRGFLCHVDGLIHRQAPVRRCIAGASLTPSRRKPTTWCIFFAARMMRSF